VKLVKTVFKKVGKALKAAFQWAFDPEKRNKVATAIASLIEVAELVLPYVERVAMIVTPTFKGDEIAIRAFQNYVLPSKPVAEMTKSDWSNYKRELAIALAKEAIPALKDMKDSDLNLAVEDALKIYEVLQGPVQDSNG